MSESYWWCGIGSRSTPENVLAIMEQFATFMARKGHTLRTGGAQGADSAFMYGCRTVVGKAEIFLPWQGYRSPCMTYSPLTWEVTIGVSKEAMQLTRQFHPAWEKCSQAARALHARNAYIILGRRLDLPAKFVVAWTRGGSGGGGTGQGLRIAKAHNVPILDLGAYTEAQDMMDALNTLYQTHSE